MRNVNLSNVADEAPRPQAGGYVLTIADVTDVPMDPKTGKGDYLTIDYDFAEGEFAEYYYGKYKTFGFWGGHFVRSYKPKALGMFKGFINELKKDNPRFAEKWNDDGENDEKIMIGCKFGAVLGEEEYIGNDGKIKTRLNVAKIISIDDVHAGKFKVPETKKVERPKASSGVVDTTQQSFEQLDKDAPF